MSAREFCRRLTAWSVYLLARLGIVAGCACLSFVLSLAALRLCQEIESTRLAIADIGVQTVLIQSSCLLFVALLVVEERLLDRKLMYSYRLASRLRLRERGLIVLDSPMPEAQRKALEKEYLFGLCRFAIAFVLANLTLACLAERSALLASMIWAVRAFHGASLLVFFWYLFWLRVRLVRKYVQMSKTGDKGEHGAVST